ncbi:hypothetical protein HOL59_06240 [Candidatus Woesearchaeota archaeon]|nr:hypothetical protein [Candidatus Woesearchaeota archaeon]
MSSLAEKINDYYQFRHHTLEDIAGMTHDKIISYGEGADIIGDLLSKRYPGVVNLNDVQDYFYNKSDNNKEYFHKMFNFGKALERLV